MVWPLAFCSAIRFLQYSRFSSVIPQICRTSNPRRKGGSRDAYEISLFARQCLGGRRIPDLKTLRRETRSWNRRMNQVRKKINWTFDRKAARLKFGYKT